MSTSPDFLLVRGSDLVVLGVRWTGFTLGPDAAGGRRLVADGPGGQIAVTFPPQAVGEAKFTSLGEMGRRGARVSGPSTVVFEVQAGTEIQLGVEGILAALAASGQRVVPTGAGMPTAIELPWRMTTVPEALPGGEVVSRHDALPVEAPSTGVVGLWRARLRGDGGSEADAGIALRPLAANGSDDGLDVRPLDAGQRQSVVDALPARAHAARLELSALGGSLSARLRSDTVEWDHEATLGRDQRVRLAERGVLYPFGHRAVYIETAQRRFDPDGSPSVAGLHREEVLIVTEPVRSMADDDTRLVRQFPFSEVEILESRPAIRAATFLMYHRTPRPDVDLAGALAALETERNELTASFNDQFTNPDVRPQTLDAYIELIRSLGTSSAIALDDAIFRASRDPDAMQAHQDGLEEQIRFLHLSITEETDPETATALLAQAAELTQQIVDDGVTDAAIAEARAEQPFVQQRLDAARALVLGEFSATDTLEEFISSQAAFSPTAQRWLDLNVLIPQLAATIADVQAQQATDHRACWLPLATDGQPLLFPLRCAGAAGDVLLSVPLVFVRDFRLEANEHFDAVESLRDSDVMTMATSLWNGATATGHVAVPGARIDMVRAGAPAPPPGDVHEVHAMTLEGVAVGGTFRPRIRTFDVELPALRSLVPKAGGRQALTFASEFLEGAGVPETPFRLASDILVDFVADASRSGGLVSPRYEIDVISRTLGPVAKAALPPDLGGLAGGGPMDLASVYAGATLLGFPLASLIKTAEDTVPLPPAIVQLFENGIPSGMKMQWTLELDEHGPFKPKDETLLTLTAMVSPSGNETVCTVNDFALVLPPGGSAEGLLTLTFRSLTFTQRNGKAPDLEIEGLQLGFGGALKLLQELQAELAKVIDLPGNRPTVDAGPTGIKAGYGVAVPIVPAGAFLIRNVAMHVGVDVPFDGKPVTVSLSFATRNNPFGVSVLTFGGGGYLDLTIGPGGLERIDASIEFGAFVEVDFFVAKGEVHALGGVRFVQDGGAIAISGYLRIGGSVEVLGLVSVSIELLVTLAYTEPNRLVGRATIVIEIDLTLFAESVEIDSGEWVLAGGEPGLSDRPPLPTRAEDDLLAQLQAYRGAFAAT